MKLPVRTYYTYRMLRIMHDHFCKKKHGANFAKQAFKKPFALLDVNVLLLVVLSLQHVLAIFFDFGASRVIITVFYFSKFLLVAICSLPL